MTSREQMNKILDELQACEFDWQDMIWFRHQLEELIRIAKTEAHK